MLFASRYKKNIFIPFVHGETETKLVGLWKIPGYPPKIRLPSTTNTFPVPEPGNYVITGVLTSSYVIRITLWAGYSIDLLPL